MDSLLAYKRTYASIRPRLVSHVVDGHAQDQANSSERIDEIRDTRAVRQRKAELLRKLLPPLADAIFTLDLHSKVTSGSLKLLTAGWCAGTHFQAVRTASFP
jgi:hypothetical protein